MDDGMVWIALVKRVVSKKKAMDVKFEEDRRPRIRKR